MIGLAILLLIGGAAWWATGRESKPYKTLFEQWPHGEPHTWDDTQ